MPKETEDDFWKEDADRVNKMSELAGDIDVKEGNPPELNEDGSLKDNKSES